MDVIVRKYGLLAPLDWGEDCEAEMRRMTALWNRLVEIEQAHRAAVTDLTAGDVEVARLDAELTAAKEARAALIDERKKTRARMRSKVPTPDLDAQIVAAKPRIAELAAARKIARKAAREKVRPGLKALDKARYAAVTSARQVANWGGEEQYEVIMRIRALKAEKSRLLGFL